MSKPIFIVEVPLKMPKEQIEVLRKVIKESFPDYNTLGIQSQYTDEFKYTVINKEFKEVSFTASGNDLKGVLDKYLGNE